MGNNKEDAQRYYSQGIDKYNAGDYYGAIQGHGS